MSTAPRGIAPRPRGPEPRVLLLYERAKSTRSPDVALYTGLRLVRTTPQLTTVDWPKLPLGFAPRPNPYKGLMLLLHHGSVYV